MQTKKTNTIQWSDIDSSNWLYRYRCFDDTGSSLEALQQGRLYFSTPAWFNDPYDCLVFASTQRIWGEMYYNINRGMDDYISSIKEIAPLEAFIADHEWNNDKSGTLDKTYNLFRICLRDVRGQIRNNTKIICFSELHDSMLMWSHYANYHKGFALAYDKDEIRKSTVFTESGECLCNSVRCEPVNYVNKQIDLTDEVGWYVRENVMPKDSAYNPVDRSVGVMKIRRVLLEKAEVWSYEKEWRVTERALEFTRKSKASYLSCKPKAIIVGSKAEQQNHEQLIEIAREQDIPIFRMYLSEDEKGFSLRPGRGDPFYCF